jgi:hypothetical protein
MNLARVSKKVPHEDNRMTLTAIHDKKMKEFSEYYASLPEKEALLTQLSRKYRGLRNVYNNEAYSLKKQIKDLENEIEEMKEKTDESEYLLKASYYLQEYKKKNKEVSLVEDQKDVDSMEFSSFVTESKKSNKGQISKSYIQECLSDGLSLGTEITNKKKPINLMCEDCGIDKVVNHKEALAMCLECGDTIEYQDNEICNEFSEEIEVLSPFSYKRINHFKEWISMLLARESSSPPEDVIDALLIELKKDRITSREDVTRKRIRDYLRKLGKNKQYEHIPSIIHKICGTEPPKISRELENKLISMFEEIQVPFDKHKPDSRKNFLSYSYCLYKMSQLLGQDQLLESFSLLKSREKLYEQDLIWRKICTELQWKFYPSL